MDRHKITGDQAFALRTNIRLRELAEQLVASGEFTADR